MSSASSATYAVTCSKKSSSTASAAQTEKLRRAGIEVMPPRAKATTSHEAVGEWAGWRGGSGMQGATAHAALCLSACHLHASARLALQRPLPLPAMSTRPRQVSSPARVMEGPTAASASPTRCGSGWLAGCCSRAAARIIMLSTPTAVAWGLVRQDGTSIMDKPPVDQSHPHLARQKQAGWRHTNRGWKAGLV